MKYHLIIFQIILILATSVLSPLSIAIDNHNNVGYNNELIVVFGETREETVTLDILSNLLPNSKVVEYKKNLEIEKDTGVFYVGHGSKEGIKYKNHIVRWEEIRTNSENKNMNYFISCYSENVHFGIGFSGLLDGILAASYSVMLYAIYKGNLDLFDKSLNAFNERMVNIQNGSPVMNLAASESGKIIAAKDEYRKGFLYSEHILWINGEQWVGQALIIAINAGRPAVEALGWVAILAGMLGVSVTIMSLILIAVVAGISIGLSMNMYYRQTYHDFKIGLGAMVAPFPSLRAWWDNEPDQYKITIPDPTYWGAVAWFGIVAAFPNYWVGL